MPQSAPTPCRHPGCGALVSARIGYCVPHAQERRAELTQKNRAYGRARKTRDADEIRFYNSSAWKNTRRAFLMRNPLCEMCAARDRLTPANTVDHRIPVKDGGERWDFDNLRALCTSCHNGVTARQTQARRRDPFADPPAPKPPIFSEYTF